MNKVIKNKSERKFLVESPSLRNKTYLLEVEGGEAAIEKYKKDPNIPIYLVGLIQKGDAPNRNNRIYPFSILKKECERYLREEVADNQAYSELDHPAESTVPELKNACAMIVDIWFKGTEVYGRVKLLNAYASAGDPALKCRNIILNGGRLGISSRALGSVSQDRNGIDVVEDDLEIICWDIVSRESTYGANLKLEEGKSKRKKNSLLLTETQCFGGSCNIKTSRQIIKEKKMASLSHSEKVYLEVLGVEKFLQLKNKK